MRVFHGTANYNLEAFLQTFPIKKHRAYLPRQRKAFSASLDFEIAVLFALRRTPAVSNWTSPANIGIVLEFGLWAASEGKDYVCVQDPRAIQNEQEVSVFSVEKLKLLAVWRMQGNAWCREDIRSRVRRQLRAAGA